MKTKIERHSRSVISVLLAVCMVISCMAVGLVNVSAYHFYNITYCAIAAVFTHTPGSFNGDHTLSKKNNDSNNWEETFYLYSTTNTSSNWEYNFKVKIHANHDNQSEQSDRWISNGDTTYSGDSYDGYNLTYDQSDDKVRVNGCASGYRAVTFEFWGNYGDDNKLNVRQSDVAALTGDVSIPGGTIRSGDAVTLTGTAGGGTGSLTTSYSISPSIDGGVKTDNNYTFTAPEVSEDTTYTVTYTIRDSNISGLTKTVNKTFVVKPAGSVVRATAMTSSFNLATGLNEVPEESTTGGTVDPTSAVIPDNGTQTYTVSAKTGYTFDGWYTDALCTTAVTPAVGSIAIHPTTKALTITAPASPADPVTYYALFKRNDPGRVTITVDNPENGTVSASWNGTTKTNGGQLTNVPIGATVELSAKATNPLQFKPSGTFTKSEGTSIEAGESTFVADVDCTVSTSFTARPAYSVKTVTNDSELGVVSVDKSVAEAGETVTVTLRRVSGAASLKSLTVKQDGGEGTVTPSGEGFTRTFTMPAYNTKVTSEWSVYSEAASLYYDGYDTSHVKDNNYDTLQFTEAKYNDQTYAYYHVQRTGANQVFTVKTTPGAAPESGGGYFYLKAVKDLSPGCRREPRRNG